MMPPQPHRNGSQFAGDDSTRVLSPVGKGGGCGRPYCDLQRKFGAEHGHFGDRRHPPYFRPADETAVIPVTPAQPRAEWDKPELPDCKKRSMAIALIFGAGMVVGALIATIRWWFG